MLNGVFIIYFFHSFTLNEIITWEKAVSDLEKNNFLNKINRDTTLNKDGASWLLESRLNNSYHYIIRWDTGNAEGKELNTFAKTIIQIANGIVGIKSKR